MAFRVRTRACCPWFFSLLAIASAKVFFAERFEDGWDKRCEYLHQPGKKRWLTADQVQFLEKSFDVENKLEPERKVLLAKDIGLHLCILCV
ncbi:hypothetical protein ACFX2A_041047 [Malus domestica]